MSHSPFLRPASTRTFRIIPAGAGPRDSSHVVQGALLSVQRNMPNRSPQSALHVCQVYRYLLNHYSSLISHYSIALVLSLCTSMSMNMLNCERALNNVHVRFVWSTIYN